MASTAENPAPMTGIQENQKDAAKPKNRKPVDKNKTKNRKTMEKGFLDIALLTTNIGHMKSLMKKQGTDTPHPLYTWVIGGLIVSIVLQVSPCLPLFQFLDIRLSGYQVIFCHDEATLCRSFLSSFLAD